MIDVAREFTADLASLPPRERRDAGLRAAALNGVARDLLAGTPAKFPDLNAPPAQRRQPPT